MSGLLGETHHDALPLGTRLGEFELRRQLGEGGFSVVYLAWDHSLERPVALKEYLPSSLATRVAGGTVQPRSERMRDTFEMGLRSFINEARALAQFDHPALVKVHRFWEANGTAYMVMPYYEGRTLKQTVLAMPQPPGEAWLLGLLAPLTEALCVLHAARWFHRDIAPDNVVLLADSGQPLLLDFGAARRVIGESTQDLTAILKPGYAPLEQYGDAPGLKQGAWTDVYALAAAVYWTIMGRTPPPSVGRVVADSYVPLAQAAKGRYSETFLRAIDAALAVLPDRRTPSIEAFRQQIGLAAVGRERLPPPAAPEPPRAPAAGQQTTLIIGAPQAAQPGAQQVPRVQKRRVAWALAAGLLAVGATAMLWRPREPAAGAPAPPVVERPVPAAEAAAQAPAPEAAPTPAPAPVPSPSALPPPPQPRPEAVHRPTRTPGPPAAAPVATPRAAPPPPQARDADSASPRARECAALLQRLSLGEDSQAISERIAALGCR